MNARRLTNLVGVQTPTGELKPLADASNFLKEIYRASSRIVFGHKFSRGEFPHRKDSVIQPVPYK